MDASEQAVKIDLSLIPQDELETTFLVVAAGIRRALSDPEKRKDYERFKAEYLAGKEQTYGERAGNRSRHKAAVR